VGHTDVAETSGRGLRDKLTTEVRYVPAHIRKNLYVSSFVLMTLGTLLFVSLAVQAMDNVGIVNADRSAESWFVSIRTPFWTTFNEVLAVMFGPISLPIVVLVVTVLWIVVSTHAWRPLVLAGAMTLGVVLIQILTRVVRRHRPPVDLMLFGKDTTFSFPSGHVAGTADFFLLLPYLLVSRNPTRGRIATAIVVAVTVISSQVLSRLYLGYHWLSDTLASLCLAMVVLGLVMAIDTRRTVRVPGERVTGELSKVQSENT
jgi:membrane-associated phospholipid phosphatase